MRLPTIDLTNEEMNLLAQINFSSQNRDEIKSSLEPQRLLTELLLKRNAISAIRLNYLCDPEFHPSGRGKSRIQKIEENGTSVDELLSHPTFMKHLEYFIYGPNLPDHIISDFISTTVCAGQISLSDIQTYSKKARDFVRKSGANLHTTVEEFFKLAIENGAHPSSANSLRESILSVR